MNILSILGSRPQYMKLDKDLPQTIVETGQHYSDALKYGAFSKSLGLPKPDYSLGAKTLEQMVLRLLKVLRKETPKVVCVYGDTRSTLAGAIAASELNIPIVHVEAGMRCGRPDMPEERNRIAVDHMSTWCMAPDQYAMDNLAREGITRAQMIGNVMFDTFASFCPIPASKGDGTYLYLSVHRQENADSQVRLWEIFEGVKGKERVIFPVHPRTKKNIRKFKLDVPANVEIREPLSYKENLRMISGARRVLTDSGGVQNEAYWMRRPCAVLRRETEWKGGRADGWSVLTDADAINIRQFLQMPFALNKHQRHMPEVGAKRLLRDFLLNL